MLANFQILKSFIHYIKLVLSNIALLPKPIPMLNKIEPTKHNKTFTIVLLSGVIIGIIININIPMPKAIRSDNHSFCFAKTLAKLYYM